MVFSFGPERCKTGARSKTRVHRFQQGRETCHLPSPDIRVATLSRPWSNGDVRGNAKAVKGVVPLKVEP
jgi:hypothetical protein